jgi:hypothetical protein
MRSTQGTGSWTADVVRVAVDRVAAHPARQVAVRDRTTGREPSGDPTERCICEDANGLGTELQFFEHPATTTQVGISHKRNRWRPVAFAGPCTNCGATRCFSSLSTGDCRRFPWGNGRVRLDCAHEALDSWLLCVATFVATCQSRPSNPSPCVFERTRRNLPRGSVYRVRTRGRSRTGSVTV